MRAGARLDDRNREEFRERLMYGLPKDADLSFLQDQPLVQVCIGEHDAILNFADASISIQSTIVYQACASDPIRCSSYIEAARLLAMLLGQTVVKVAIERPGTLLLTFSAGTVLSICDDSAEYESYVISHASAIIVV